MTDAVFAIDVALDVVTFGASKPFADRLEVLESVVFLDSSRTKLVGKRAFDQKGDRGLDVFHLDPYRPNGHRILGGAVFNIHGDVIDKLFGYKTLQEGWVRAIGVELDDVSKGFDVPQLAFEIRHQSGLATGNANGIENVFALPKIVHAV